MTLIKRCYGCGKLLYPWQDIIRTKLVGRIHTGCAVDARTNYLYDIDIKRLTQQCEKAALRALNEGEKDETL
jgi:hypothetical protein